MIGNTNWNWKFFSICKFDILYYTNISIHYSCAIPQISSYSELGRFSIVTAPPGTSASRINTQQTIEQIIAKNTGVIPLELSASLGDNGNEIQLYGKNATLNGGDMHFIYEAKGFRHPRT